MVSLGEAFTIFLCFYAVFTPIIFFLFESRIEKLEGEIKELEWRLHQREKRDKFFKA